MTVLQQLHDILARRILLLDGAMGTMIQQYKLDEAAVRGDRFRNHHKAIKNVSDVLNVTHPGIIAKIHHQYLEAGADIIETNTFNGTTISRRSTPTPGT